MGSSSKIRAQKYSVDSAYFRHPVCFDKSFSAGGESDRSVTAWHTVARGLGQSGLERKRIRQRNETHSNRSIASIGEPVRRSRFVGFRYAAI